MANLSSYQRGVYYSGAKLFNSLPISITNLKNDKQFRIALGTIGKTILFILLMNLLYKQNMHT